MSDAYLDKVAAPASASEVPASEAVLQEEDPASVTAPAAHQQPLARSASLREYRGTAEHIAAQRPLPPLDPDAPEVRQRLSPLRAELTTILTDLRWQGLTVQEAASRAIPLLDIGPLQQWAPVLVTHLLEIDRAGNLLPVWLEMIERGDPSDIPPGSSAAETAPGKARRVAILLLGAYKTPEISQLLGRLALDPDVSLYATQALLRQNTRTAWQTLIAALKEAEGWARVDLVEACLKLKQPSFYELLLAVGLERIDGLERYVAVPLYRSIPLEAYLNPETALARKSSQQAALVCYYVFLESIQSATTNPEQPPVAFERELPRLESALFAAARRSPSWQRVVALHHLATLLGRYWGGITRGLIKEPRVVTPVMACLPMMNEIEQWMNGPGREVLLASLPEQDTSAWSPLLKTLVELHEVRASAYLLAQLGAVTTLQGYEQAQRLALACDSLARLGDGRAVEVLLRLAERFMLSAERRARPQRAEQLPPDDDQVPVSILSAAILRALMLTGDRRTLDLAVQAASDFDPVVRSAALELIKQLDPRGEERRCRMAVREALSDPTPSVAAQACLLVAQYQDLESIPALRYLVQARPALQAAATTALQQLGQPVV
jgi:HEAT repeat protein